MGFIHENFSQFFETPPSELWKILSDTDRLNRHLGLPSVDYRSISISGSLPFQEGTIKIAGLFRLSWLEYPFEWNHEKSYSVLRKFNSGPVKWIRLKVELIPENSGTRVQTGYEVETRYPFLRTVLSFFLGQTAEQLFQYCKARLLENRQESSKKEAEEETSLKTRLLGFLKEASESEVLRIRPFELASRWQADKFAVLKTCLRSTREGILDLSWELMCPTCRVSKSSSEVIYDMPSKIHCDLCGIDFTVDQDRYTEVCFRVAKRIRKTENAVFCIGSPARSTHILNQLVVPAKGKVLLSSELKKPDYRLRVLGKNKNLLLKVGAKKAEKGTAHALSLSNESWNKEVLYLVEGQHFFEIENQTTDSMAVVLEEEDWDANAATAAMVTTLQEFRDLFGSEALRRDQELKVQNLTFLFSDLKDSTALYESVGDPKALALVQDHFKILTEEITNRNGSIVKTIGDAVMAVFYAPEDALLASLAIQKRFPSDSGLITIKIGLHRGPALAIQANNLMDYFGRTVNLAARIQAESMGNDIVMSQALFETDEVQALIQNERLSPKKLDKKVKGIPKTLSLFQLDCVPKKSRRAA